jgi:hypothetical protein
MRRILAILPISPLALLCSLGGHSPITLADYPIAGIAPDQRPEGAPIVQQAEHDGAWYTTALTGLSQPYPRSFRFLEDQGEWYTPFNRPGMEAPYDIRGWHQQK